MDTNCPYCGAGIEINHDDGYGYEEDGRHKQECGECKTTFAFTTSILYCYKTEKAECLNDGGHEYKKTTIFPEEFSEMRCTMCDKEREMTKEERVSFGIGTIESYFKKLK